MNVQDQIEKWTPAQKLLLQLTTVLISQNLSPLYPYIACEVICCEIFSICEALMSNVKLLESFWQFLDRPAPLNPLQASYFSKVNGVLIQKKVPEMIEFIKAQPRVLEKMLEHIANSSIAELLLKIISAEEMPDGQGIVMWLSKQGLIPNLIDRLNPNLDVEVHNTASQTLLDIIAVSYQSINAAEMGDGTSAGSGGSNLVEELKSDKIMRTMVDFMLDRNAPNATSSLANGINIIIELIRRYCSEIEQAEYQQHQYQTQQVVNSRGLPLPTQEKIHALSTDLNDLLRVIGERVEEFADLLVHPRNLGNIDTTMGNITPLGSERLKTCELFAEILHLQYLYFSSPLFDRLVFGQESKPPASVEDPPMQDTAMGEAGVGGSGTASAESGASVSSSTGEAVVVVGSGGEASVAVTETAVVVTESVVVASGEGSAVAAETMKVEASVDALTAGLSNIKIKGNVADELVLVTERFIKANILPMCLSLFFEFPWNNFLHSVVYDMIAKVFNTYSFTATTAIKPPEGELPTSLAAIEVKMNGVKESFKKLVLSILWDGELTKRIVAAQTKNDDDVAGPKGVRLGYMGHLTYISDEVCKLMEKCANDFDEEVKALVFSPSWQGYVQGVLNETKERDRQPLGGARPAQQGAPHHMPHVTGAFGGMDDADIGAGMGYGETVDSGISGAGMGGDGSMMVGERDSGSGGEQVSYETTADGFFDSAAPMSSSIVIGGGNSREDESNAWAANSNWD
ncbi:hypothetical protein HDU76_002935 [Blyttiomyces sp. JEL0837]|nr:hypothetical protein HDU76_002935 [Blyttiomyces sp. JEL0837]